MKIRKQAGQVYFDSSDYVKIKNLASKQGISFAEFVRNSVLEKLSVDDFGVKKVSDLPILKLGGEKKFDTAINLDKYLY